MSDMTLGNGLADPMGPVDIRWDPPTLPSWEERKSYRLNYRVSADGLTWAGAVVGQFEHHIEAKPGLTWLAHCAITGREDFRAWHPTAAAAQEAVEEHIAAHLNGETR